MFKRYREYQVTLARPEQNLTDVELKTVTVMAWSKRSAEYKVILKTPGIWTVVKGETRRT